MSTGDKTNLAYEFGPFRLDPSERLLLRVGQAIGLTPKAFDLLCRLIEHRPRVVEKMELLGQIWPDTFVVEANLKVLIGEIRRALGDNNTRPTYISSVPKRGYIFIAPIFEAPPERRSIELELNRPARGSVLPATTIDPATATRPSAPQRSGAAAWGSRT